MKLRKILAGFLAGTIAMTSSVVMSVTASAAEDTVTYISSEITAATKGDTFQSFSAGSDFVNYICDYETFEVEFKVSADAIAEIDNNQWLAANCIGVLFQETNAWTGTYGNTFSFGHSNPYGLTFDTTTVYTATAKTADMIANACTLEGVTEDNFATICQGAINAPQLGGVTIVSATFKDPKVEVDSNTIYNDSKDLGTDWGADIQIYNISANEGDFIQVTYEIGSEGYQQVSLSDGSEGWPALSSPVVNQYNTIDLSAGSTTYKVKLNSTDAEAITANGLVLKGYNITVTKVEILTPISDTPTTYDITIDEAIENGTITVDGDLTEAAVGDTVTLKVTPDKYYKLGTLTVMGKEAVTTTDNKDSTYSFEMPAAKVSVAAEFIVDTAALKTDIDAAVKSLATVTKASTYTTADYEAELETAIKTIEFTGLTVDISALKETKATEEATGSIAGTVTIEAGETAITTLTANVTLDKVPTDPVEVAAEAVKAYLAKVTFDNEFHATNQAEAIKEVAVKAAPTANVDAYFMVKEATEDAAGSVTGTITIIATDSEKKEIIEVNETIAKLPAKVYADNQAALEALKVDDNVLIQTATQADGKLKSQRFVQKVTMDDVKKATGVRYDFMRSDGKTCSITGDYQCYYKSVAGVQAGTDEAFLSVTMKNIPKDMIVMCTITLLYN